jgi:hypothetical protein
VFYNKERTENEEGIDHGPWDVKTVTNMVLAAAAEFIVLRAATMPLNTIIFYAKAVFFSSIKP